MNELLKDSGLELAAKIAKKQVSPSEVLEAHITRIEQVNPSLNALVENDFERARALASQQTEQLVKNNKDLPIYFGVPFTVKEMFSYKGMKRTGGSVHHTKDVMDWDATVVARMKAAGAIPLGTTNVPELGFWFETHNPVYGTTNNPYDTSRTCGGSSGGEGALLGAGATPLGLGSDIGGSIRIPAFFCGVFGHKPTRHLLPLTGAFPYGLEDFQNLHSGKYPFTSMGPMSRRARDLYAMTEILKGPDGHDLETLQQVTLGKPVEDWAGKKVLICPSPYFHQARETDEEMAQVVRNCGKLFQEMGADVHELPARFFVRSAELWFAAVKSTKSRHLYQILKGPKEEFSVSKELLKLAVGKGEYTLPNLVVSLAEMLDTRTPDLTEQMLALEKMKKDLDHLLGPEGVLILPPHPRVAPKHKAPLWSPFDFIYAGIFTATGHPATVAPMGLNDEGLPLGVQIVARQRQDHLTISCAEFLESTFGGWQLPLGL